MAASITEPPPTAIRMRPGAARRGPRRPRGSAPRPAPGSMSAKTCTRRRPSCARIVVDRAARLGVGVGHDQGAGVTSQLAQVVDRARVEVGVRRDAEPLRRRLPVRDRLDVEQVAVVDVVGGRRAAPGAAAEREGRRHRVVDAAERADGGRCVDEDATGADRLGEALDDGLVGRVDGRRVAQAAVLGDQLAGGDARGRPSASARARGPASASPAGTDARRARRGRTAAGRAAPCRASAASMPAIVAEVGHDWPSAPQFDLPSLGEGELAPGVATSSVRQHARAHALELGDDLVVDRRRRPRRSARPGRSPTRRRSSRSACRRPPSARPRCGGRTPGRCRGRR